MRLSDQTRRRLTLAIFLALGPALLASVAGLVIFRRGSGAIWREESALSARFGHPVRLAGVDYPRPEEQRFYGLSWVRPETEEAILFIPEIHSFPLEASADEPADDASAPSSATVRRRWRIPTLYMRASALPELSQWATQGVGRFGGKSAPPFSLRFDIDCAVPIADDAEFDRLVAEYQPPKRGERITPERGEPTHGFDAVNDSADAIEARIKRFSEEPEGRALERVEGSFQNSPERTSFECAFRFTSIPAMAPCRLTIARSPLSDERSVMFDTANGPFPATFLATFLPIFEAAGPSSWFTGKIESRWAADGTCRVALPEGALFRADLAPTASRMSATPLSGQVARLTFDAVTVENGVFLGRGELHLVRGALDKRFFARLTDLLSLRFQPAGALSNNFPNDAVPYDQLQIRFEFRPDGAFFQSAYPSGVIGACSGDRFSYSVFLPTDAPQSPIPYQKLLSTLDESDRTFWTPFYRDAMNHLPVEYPVE